MKEGKRRSNRGVGGEVVVPPQGTTRETSKESEQPSLDDEQKVNFFSGETDLTVYEKRLRDPFILVISRISEEVSPQLISCEGVVSYRVHTGPDNPNRNNELGSPSILL